MKLCLGLKWCLSRPITIPLHLAFLVASGQATQRKGNCCATWELTMLTCENYDILLSSSRLMVVCAYNISILKSKTILHDEKPQNEY